MTDDEMRVVAKIMTKVDGGCHYCARDIMDDLVARFPDQAAIIDEVYDEEFNS